MSNVILKVIAGTGVVVSLALLRKLFKLKVENKVLNSALDLMIQIDNETRDIINELTKNNEDLEIIIDPEKHPTLYEFEKNMDGGASDAQLVEMILKKLYETKN